MKVKTIRTHYDKCGLEKGLEETINKIGYGNILQILPCYCGGSEYFYTIIYKDSKEGDRSIDVLETQIPKKPTLEGDGYADGHLVYDTWICPNCEEHYEVDYDEYDFCPKCGQAIDWSEEDER